MRLDNVSDMNYQTDDRELTEAAINQRILNTWKGDKVLFNDRVKPLTVTDCPGEMKEWEVVFTPDEFNDVAIMLEARTKDLLEVNEGEVVDWKVGIWDPPYEVTGIYECTCPSCKRLDKYELRLEGPQGGKYVIENTEKGVRVYNISADWSYDIEVKWFQNQSR